MKSASPPHQLRKAARKWGWRGMSGLRSLGALIALQSKWGESRREMMGGGGREEGPGGGGGATPPSVSFLAVVGRVPLVHGVLGGLHPLLLQELLQLGQAHVGVLLLEAGQGLLFEG